MTFINNSQSFRAVHNCLKVEKVQNELDKVEPKAHSDGEEQDLKPIAFSLFSVFHLILKVAVQDNQADHVRHVESVIELSEKFCNESVIYDKSHRKIAFTKILSSSLRVLPSQ